MHSNLPQVFVIPRLIRLGCLWNSSPQMTHRNHSPPLRRRSCGPVLCPMLPLSPYCVLGAYSRASHCAVSIWPESHFLRYVITKILRDCFAVGRREGDHLWAWTRLGKFLRLAVLIINCSAITYITEMSIHYVRSTIIVFNLIGKTSWPLLSDLQRKHHSLSIVSPIGLVARCSWGFAWVKMK